jgi:hypothetical protein
MDGIQYDFLSTIRDNPLELPRECSVPVSAELRLLENPAQYRVLLGVLHEKRSLMPEVPHQAFGEFEIGKRVLYVGPFGVLRRFAGRVWGVATPLDGHGFVGMHPCMVRDSWFALNRSASDIKTGAPCGVPYMDFFAATAAAPDQKTMYGA